MKVLVVGGTGFVGKYLVQHILDNYDWSVNVTHTDKLTEKDNRIEYHELNILNFVDVKSLLLSISPDLIFHLAAQSSVVSSWDNPQNTVQVNVIGTLNILEAVRLLKNKPKILLIGSSEEYGAIEKQELPINEENELRPRNTYAITKIAQNHLGKLYSDAYDMEIIIARPFNHIGPGQSEKFVVSDFCKQVAEIENGIHEKRILVGNLESRRDFTDVRDIVKVYPKLILSGVSGEIYNVGSGTDISIKCILNKILDLSKSDIEIEIDSTKFRPIDIPVIKSDITKLKKTLDWEPEIIIEETINDTLNYWREKISGGNMNVNTKENLKI